MKRVTLICIVQPVLIQTYVIQKKVSDIKHTNVLSTVFEQCWFSLLFVIGLNIFYSSQDIIKDQAERKAMFSPNCGEGKRDRTFSSLHWEMSYSKEVIAFNSSRKVFLVFLWENTVSWARCRFF